MELVFKKKGEVQFTIGNVLHNNKLRNILLFWEKINVL